MGLDLGFSRRAALAAGLVVKQEVRDPAGALDNSDKEMQQWCDSIILVVEIPGTEFLVEDDGVGEHIVVRANKWGQVYAPLTAFLKQHNIPWEEF